MFKLILTALLVTANATGNKPWKWETTVDIFEGTLQGFFGSSQFPALKSCANETVDAYDQIADAFKKLHTGDESGDTIKAGLEDIGAALGDLKNALNDCKASSKEITQFASTVEQGFEHPLSFVFHLGKDLIVNGKDIFDEISQAVNLWDKQDYRNAGIQIGEALALLIGTGEEEIDTMVDLGTAIKGWKWETTVDVFEGTLQGFFGSSQFPALKSCANETVDAYDQIADAFKKLHTGDESGDTIKAGLEDIGAALGDLKNALNDCKASSKEITQFASTVEQGFEHPLTFIFHLGKDLIVNGKDIFDEISQAVNLWDKQDYRNAGIQIGEALALLIGTGDNK